MGLFGGIASFFGGKKTTQTQSLDPRSQAYVDQLRNQSQGAANTAVAGPNGPGSSWFQPQTMSIGQQAGQFFNPYLSNVVDATRNEYDQLRNQAMVGTSQQATAGGAYGGSRAAALAGNRLGQLDVGQANTIANQLNTGYNTALGMGVPYAEQQRQQQEQQLQEPLWRQQQAQQFQNLGMGPTGWNQTQSSSGGGFGSLLKGAAGLGSLYLGAGGQLPFGLGGQQQQAPQFAQPAPWQPPQWQQPQGMWR